MSDSHRAARRRALACLGGIATGALIPAARAAVRPGERFEPVTLTAAPPPNLRRALEPLRGQAVLLNFWATWCEPCRVEMPALVSLAEAEPGFALLTVAVADRMDDVRRFFDDNLIEPPVIADPDQMLARAWGVSYLPTTLALDATHRPRLRVRGELDWHDDSVRRRLRTLRQPAPTLS